MLGQVILVFIIVWLVVLRWQKRKMLDLYNKLSTTKHKPLPIIGHAYLFLGSDEDRMTAFQRMGREAMENDDGIMAVWQGSRLYLAVTDAKIAEYLLKTCLEKDDALKCLQMLTGNGSVFAPVKIWRPRRKVLAPTFSPKNLMQFAGIFARQSSVMVEQLQAAAGKGAFSIWKYITTYTMDSVCESTLGVLVNAQKQLEQPFLKSFEESAHLDSSRLCKPWLHSTTVYKMTPAYTRHTRCQRVICEFVDKIIQAKRVMMTKEKECMTESEQNKAQNGLKTFLELLIETTGGDGGYTDLELREETLVLIVAGTDTSAVGTAFTSVLLSRHPDVQEKVYQELQDVFGDSDRPISAEDLPRLKYMDAVIRESLRLYPPVPIIARKVTDEEVTLPSGVFLVEGCGIIIHIWAILRNPRYWGQDAEVFRPERFMDAPPKHPAAFMPFSHGPRACIGYQYAMMSMKTAIATLLRQYRVLPATDTGDQTPLRVKFDVMMKDVDDFIVQIEPRTRAPGNRTIFS